MANINTRVASEQVEEINRAAVRVMVACNKMHENLRITVAEMQTGMGDTVRRTADEADRQISQLSREMKKLQDYMQSLTAHIQKYSQCAYRNASVSRYHANVAEDDIHRYIRYTEEYRASLHRFSTDLQDTCSRLGNEISRAKYMMDEHHSSCQTSMRYLKDKIFAVKGAIERVKANLENKKRELESINQKIQEEMRRADDARRSAAAVVIPPYRSTTYRNSDGSTYTRDNSAEIRQAESRRNSYLAIAEQHMEQVRRLEIEKSRVEEEISRLQSKLNEYCAIKADMENTQAELNAHMGEVQSASEKLGTAKSQMQRVREQGSQTCQTMQSQADGALNNLRSAASSIRAYHNVSLQRPDLS